MKMKPPKKSGDCNAIKISHLSQLWLSVGHNHKSSKNQSSLYHLLAIWTEMGGSDSVFVPLELLEELGILLHSF